MSLWLKTREDDAATPEAIAFAIGTMRYADLVALARTIEPWRSGGRPASRARVTAQVLADAILAFDTSKGKP